jgi:chromosome segregation ATPase
MTDWQKEYASLEDEFSEFSASSAELERAMETEIEELKERCARSDALLKSRVDAEKREKEEQKRLHNAERRKLASTAESLNAALSEQSEREENQRRKIVELEMRIDELESSLRHAEASLESAGERLEAAEERSALVQSEFDGLRECHREFVQQMRGELYRRRSDLKAERQRRLKK